MLGIVSRQYLVKPEKLGSGLHPNAARNGANLHSPARIAHSRSQAVFVLILNHYRNSRPDVSRNRFRREMKIR